MDHDDLEEPTSTPQLYCWAATDVGLVRSGNEDSYRTSGQLNEKTNERWEGKLKSHAWAFVADGMGGHAGGEIASTLAIECLATVLPSLATSEEVRAALEATNLALYDAMEFRRDLRGMGTTIAGISARGSSALLFNIGDSRIYAYSEGALVRLSEDHVVGGYLLTKCLGGASAPAPVEPYVREIELTPGSRILLCTDGLTGEVDDERITELLTAENPAQSLVNEALENGGRDNITVLVLRVL